MLNRKHENMPVTYHFGLKILFDGYLIGKSFLNLIALKINDFLFDAYLINSRILCDGYVAEQYNRNYNSLTFNKNSCDGYVIDKAILFDGYLIKEKL